MFPVGCYTMLLTTTELQEMDEVYGFVATGEPRQMTSYDEAFLMDKMDALFYTTARDMDEGQFCSGVLHLCSDEQ